MNEEFTHIHIAPTSYPSMKLGEVTQGATIRFTREVSGLRCPKCNELFAEDNLYHGCFIGGQ